MRRMLRWVVLKLKWGFLGAVFWNLFWWHYSPLGPVDTWWHRAGMDALFALYLCKNDEVKQQ